MAAVLFESEILKVGKETEHVTCEFLGFEGNKETEPKAKLLLKMKNGKASNLVVVTLPDAEDGGIYFVESSETNFDSEVNGYAAGAFGISLKDYMHFLLKCYYQKVGGGDEMFDVSDGEEEDWDDGDEEEWGDGADLTTEADELMNTRERKEKERYSKMKLDLLDKEKALRSAHRAKLHEQGLKENQIFKPESVAIMLVNSVLKYTQAYDCGDHSIRVEPIDENIYEWRVRFSGFPPDSQIYLNLMRLGNMYGDHCNCVELRISFLMELFPIYPPKVRLVRPRLENFMFGRIVCMEELQVAKWNPVRSLDDIFASIRAQLVRYGEVDVANPVNNPANDRPPFTELEYQLLRLSMLTEVPFRANTLMNEDDYKMASLPSIGSKAFEQTKATPPPKKQKTSHNSQGYGRNQGRGADYKAWAAGTGYGHAGDQADWDIAAWKMAQQKKDSEILGILEQIVDELTRGATAREISGASLKVIFEESCIIPFLKEYIKNDSLLDIEQHHAKLYTTIYEITEQMSAHPTLLSLYHDRCKSPSTNNVSLWELLENLYASANIAHSLTSGSSKNTASRWFGSGSGGETASGADSSIAGMILKIYATVDRALKAANVTSETDTDGDTKMDEKGDETSKEAKQRANKKYVKTMKRLRFSMVDYDAFFTNHHYKGKPTESNKTFAKRLSYEYSDLSKSLPIDPDSSVFLRVHESKMHYAKLLIVPCDGTPYGGGCFCFHAYFPPQYPNVAPKVNLMTTGKGSVRFNPNLYNCGKVCLSLLGTWHGGAQGENWNPGVSTFLQVCVSIQSLIFVPQPYFNEPGYERSMGTPEGTRRSKQYNDNIQTQTVRWAMIDILKNPPRCFEDVIKAHFKLQKERCIANATKWLGANHKLTNELKSLLRKLS